MEKPRNPDEIELAGNDSDNKNWKGIVIALLVIVIICGLVIVAVVLVTPRDEEKELGEPFGLNDLFSPNFTVQSFAGTWMGDVDVLVYRAANGDLMELDAEKNETRVFVDASVLQRRNVEKFFVSADLRYILLAYDVEQLYQHSFLARYEIYDRHSTSSENKLLKFPMSDSDKWKNRKLQYAGWSPRDHSLTFVYGNNLYFQASPTTTAFWVTDNSNSKYILNGIPDWLYEEEILRSNVAHWLSPDNRYVAYIQFNDTKVPLHRYPVYGDANDIYGSISELSYPKAGDPNGGINPVVRLFVAEVGNIKGVHRAFAPPAMLQQHQQQQDHYITLVQWKDEAHVLVAWSNRAQDTTIMTICVISSQECSENLIERQHEGWVVVNSARFIKTRKETVYLTILPLQVADKGYWKHIASVSARMHSEGVKSFLTNGEWEVSEIVGYNEEDLTVYFIGPYEKARQRHLFSLKLSPDGRKALGYPHCVTCSTGDSQCTYVYARFSRSGRYYIEECLGPGVPHYTLRSTVNNDTAVVLEDNALLRANLARKALPKKEPFSFTTDNDEKLQGQILLPPTLRKDHITLYPLLIHTYAGPGTQLVTERFTLDWSTYLVSSENVIYASIDGRGSGGRGDRFLHAVDHALGTVEVQDQIRGAGYLNESQFVDKDRIAIWGWSYGGFVVAHVLGDKDDALFRCGIAIAPITDWRYYDTAYTERYMGMATSTDNYRGYDNANVSSKAANFKGKGFLLVHGTADDNVHFQHSAQLMKALTEAGVLFQSQVYADGRHRLTSGDQTTRHLYRTMTKFLQKECWGGGKPQEAKPVATETNQKQQKGKS